MTITFARSGVWESFSATLRITKKRESPTKKGPRMCSFLCYSGPDILLSELLCSPRNSLISQSYRSREQIESLNGDGFGVGWYTPHTTATPGVFTGITPAWSNRNLKRLARHVKSPRFFAHVRAASPRMP
jgi:glutamine amidotransferase